MAITRQSIAEALSDSWIVRLVL